MKNDDDDDQKKWRSVLIKTDKFDRDYKITRQSKVMITNYVENISWTADTDTHMIKMYDYK